MATRARGRIIVKSTSKSKTSDMASSSSSTVSEGSSEGSFMVRVTSTPIHKLQAPDPHIKPRTHLKSKKNRVKPAAVHYPPHPHSVSAGVMSTHRKLRESSSSEGDEVFQSAQKGRHLSQTTPIQPTNLKAHHVRQMYMSSSHILTPTTIYYDDMSQYKQNRKNRFNNQVIPVLNLPSSVTPLSTFQYPSYLSSPSPSDTQSTFSSLSSPLPPLLIQSMRKGGTIPSARSNWQPDSVLDTVLPGGVLKVFVGTWNMNEQKVLPTCLDDFLLPVSHQTAADLFAIGTQESTPARQEWEILLQQTLGPTHILIQSAVLGVLYLNVFLRRDLIWYCSDVQSSSYATRPINIMKTKGCVGIRLSLFGSSFLFLSSHLSADVEKCLDRNSDVQKTAANIQFNTVPGRSGKSPVETHDYVFWYGDLNYRLELEKEKAESMIQEADWKSLLLKDQLTREMLTDSVFQGFSEQPIAFPPTYKFDINSSTYDTSEKARTPSWTDRVLFRSGVGCEVVGCGYQSCESVKSSDHRPVYALFLVKLKPLEEIDGVPANPAGYNRDLYTKAMKRRKQVASTCLSLQQQEEVTNGPHPVRSPKQSSSVPSNNVSSSVCTIL